MNLSRTQGFILKAALFFIAFTHLSADECQIVKRIRAHLILNDIPSALQELKQNQALYGHSKIFQEISVELLARAQDERGMLYAWDRLVEQYPEEKDNRVLIESLAWGTLDKAISSSTPQMRFIGSLAAYFANDARSVRVLQNNMRDSNALIRAATVELAADMRDTILCEEILHLFQKETSFLVRLEVIKSIGKMKIVQARGGLEAIISNPWTSAEEKAAAIQALVLLLDTINRSELTFLVQSTRAGLRQLACEAVIYFDLHENIDLILPLLKDAHAEVRAAALHVLGYLRVTHHQGQSIMGLISALKEDPDYRVAACAAWVMTLNNPGGQNHFCRLLKHELRDVRLFATAALVATGKYGLPWMKEAFYVAEDPFVKINLALGLISLRTEMEAASQVLADAVSDMKENWMWNEQGVFRALVPSNVKHSDIIPQYPKAVNQLARLEVLGLLAMVKYPKAQETIRCFLQEQTWGVTWMAAALLLTEGDDEALVMVRELLKDKDPTVRIQAALLLSLWGRDEAALETLQQAYKGANREKKAHILEGLGNISAYSSIPFLISVLKEPHQTLRVIAACALLQCLNN